MKAPHIFRKQAQAGFTLIELIVVIVILGILAATALPRMFDMSGQARLAKMQAALGAVKAAQATAHAAWLMNGGQFACATCSPTGGVQTGSLVSAEGQDIKMIGGYPEVGNDGIVNAATTATGGMVVAANLGTDYAVTTFAVGGAVATNNNLTVTPDTAHPKCSFTYTEPTQTAGGGANVQPTAGLPGIDSTALTLANCS